jgi:hypothetical protein
MLQGCYIVVTALLQTSRELRMKCKNFTDNCYKCYRLLQVLQYKPWKLPEMGINKVT